MKTKNKYNIWQVLFLIFVFIFSLKMFQYTPYESIFFKLQIGYILGLLIFMAMYMYSYLIKQKKIKYYILYYFVLVMILPIYSALNAMMAFNQPFLYGFLSQRDWILVFSGVLIYYMIVKNKLSLNTLEFSFLVMSWSSLLLYYYLALTFNPSEFYASEEKARYILISGDRGFRFNFPTFFITFGSIYYLIKFIIYKRKLHLLFMLFFLSYIFFIAQGRTYIIGILIIFFLIYYSYFSIEKLIIKLMKIFLFVLLTIVFIHFVYPEYLDKMVMSYTNMFQALIGETVEDVSSSSRLSASKKVVDFFSINPYSIITGTGRLSTQWNDGYKSIFGYFFPSDLGILGGIFVHGIVGFVWIWIIPVLFSLRTVINISERNSVFILSVKYLLVFMLVFALQGNYYFTPMIYIIPLFILLGYLDLKGKQFVNQ